MVSYLHVWRMNRTKTDIEYDIDPFDDDLYNEDNELEDEDNIEYQGYDN